MTLAGWLAEDCHVREVKCRSRTAATEEESKAPTSGNVPPPELQDFRIDGWLVRPQLNLLVKGDRSIHARPQLLDVLACLARHPGTVVTKDELRALVWKGGHVTGGAVARCIAELRGIMADDARQPRIIQTIPKRGYRLIAAVELSGACGTSAESAAPGRAAACPEPDDTAVPSPSPDRTRELVPRARFLRSTALGLLAAWRHYVMTWRAARSAASVEDTAHRQSHDDGFVSRNRAS